jgi:hypothetical protein
MENIDYVYCKFQYHETELANRIRMLLQTYNSFITNIEYCNISKRYTVTSRMPRIYSLLYEKRYFSNKD